MGNVTSSSSLLTRKGSQTDPRATLTLPAIVGMIATWRGFLSVRLNMLPEGSPDLLPRIISPLKSFTKTICSSMRRVYGKPRLQKEKRPGFLRTSPQTETETSQTGAPGTGTAPSVEPNPPSALLVSLSLKSSTEVSTSFSSGVSIG